MDVIPSELMVAGMVQIIFAAATVMLVFNGSRWAAPAAVVVGFFSAVGFAVAHLLPTWGFFSDSFINAPPAVGVTWFSWVTAIFEIVADVVFAVAAVAVLRARHAYHRVPLRSRNEVNKI